MNCLIGISGNVMPEKESFYPTTQHVSGEYVLAVSKSKATPFIMPVCMDEDIIKSMVESVDGIIITGGEDVNPLKYNTQPHLHLGQLSYERDIFDFELVKYAMELKKPIIGICRGLQVLNVYFGGTLIQDLPSQRANCIKHSQLVDSFVGTHVIDIKKGSFINNILGDSCFVNSYHHQAIDKLADVFEETAKSTDGIIESVIYKGNDNFILGFQFHPELLAVKNDKMQKIFDEFVSICKSKK